MTHEQAKKELERGTPAELICATCPWDRLCVEPPKMSSVEIDRALDKALKSDEERDPDRKTMPVKMMLTALAMGGRDSTGRLCPVFAQRLASPDGRQVADAIRHTMQTWGEPS